LSPAEAAKEKLEEAQKEQASAEQSAQDALNKLSSWSSEVQGRTGTRMDMENLVSEIEKNAESRIEEQRKQLRSVYESKLDSLKRFAENPSHAASGYGGEGVEDAARQAIAASKDLGDLYKKKLQMMKDKLRELRNVGKGKSKTLQKEVSSEAHRAMQLANRIEHLGRQAGQPEHEYEGNQEKAEHQTEKLSETGEHVGEKAEETTEKFFEQVEHVLNAKRSEMEHFAEGKEKAREQEVHQLLQQALAGEQQAPAAMAVVQPAERSAPLNFLEATGKSDPDELLRTGLLVPAVALMASLVLAAAAWIRGQRHHVEDAEQPHYQMLKLGDHLFRRV